MISRVYKSVVAAGAILALASPALALQEPRPIATDQRIQTVRYSPNEIYPFIGNYGFQSSIEFGVDEEVQTVSVGDSLAWQINPTGNRLFIKPVQQDAQTNMTVITNKYTYYFELHANEPEDMNDPTLIFALRFVYPQEDLGGVQIVSESEKLPDIEGEPEKYNFNYTLRGSDLVAPIRIFDDGEFTYFEFRDKNADIPAFFRVDAEGNEEMVNFRKRENYIVVERVASRFTLRHGPDIVCVYNEAVPHPAPPPEPGFIDRMGSKVGSVF